MYYQAIVTATIEVVATTADNILNSIQECKREIEEALQVWGDTKPDFTVSPPETWKQEE